MTVMPRTLGDIFGFRNSSEHIPAAVRIFPRRRRHAALQVALCAAVCRCEETPAVVGGFLSSALLAECPFDRCSRVACKPHGRSAGGSCCGAGRVEADGVPRRRRCAGRRRTWVSCARDKVLDSIAEDALRVAEEAALEAQKKPRIASIRARGHHWRLKRLATRFSGPSQD